MLRAAAAVLLASAAVYNIPGVMLNYDVGLPPFTDDSLPPRPIFLFGIALADWLERLQHALTPPNLQAFKLTMSHIQTATIHAGARLNLFDTLHEHGAMTLPDLTAAALNCGQTEAGSESTCAEAAPRVGRVLHALQTVNLVRRLPARGGDSAEVNAGDRWELTRSGVYLSSKHPASLHAAALNYGDDQYHFLSSIDSVVRTGRSAYEKHHDGSSQWEYLRKNPRQREIFGETMTSLARMGHNKAVAEDFDFSSAGKVVELGCGFGTQMDRILATWPAVRGVCLDLPETIDMSRDQWSRRATKDRVELTPGNFFEPSSLPGDGDVYLMRQVLHDWNDEECAQILRNVRQAITTAQRNGAKTSPRLLIVERVIEAGESFVKSQGNAQTDLVMLATFSDGTKERSLAQWRSLFASGGFALQDTVVTRSPYRVIVGTVA